MLDVETIQLPEGKHCLFIMDHSGDTRVMWDPRNDDEVTNARASFDRLRAKGYLAYVVNEDGSKGTMITTFDPNAGKVILTPPLRGG